MKNAASPQVLGKQYREKATDDNARLIAHRFADEIVLRLGGGIPGVAESKIVYVSGRTILDDHVEHGIGGLVVHTEDGSVTGEPEVRGPFTLVRLEETAPNFEEVQKLLLRKYDHDQHVILRLVEGS